MDIEEYSRSPFRNSHDAYRDSCFSFGIQPEYCTGEVLVGSCYRALGMVEATESSVDLGEVTKLITGLSANLQDLDTNPWETILMGTLACPKRPNEKGTLVQLFPLVPSLSYYSGVLGKKDRSRFNAGKLILYTIAAGAGKEREDVFCKLAEALDVNQNDDHFAFYIEKSILEMRIESGNEGRCQPNFNVFTDNEEKRISYRDNITFPKIPAEVFVKDLEQILKLKNTLVRRQWLALLESLFRIGVASHVLWICRLNNLAWQYIQEILKGSPPPSENAIEERIWSSHLGNDAFMEAGQYATHLIKRQIQEYAIARAGINYVLFMIDNLSSDPPSFYESEINSVSLQVHNLLAWISEKRDLLGDEPHAAVNNAVGDIVDGNIGQFAGDKSGAPKNLLEFMAHTLQKRREERERNIQYDHGYLLAQPTNAKNSPYVVRPGPVLLMAMCYCTAMEMRGAPTTLQDLANHFSRYGIKVSTGDLQEGMLARDLEEIGVIIDSPDAGGGRLIVNPFSRLNGGGN